MTAGDFRAAALAYARRGWAVVPVRPRAKAPLVRWEPFQRRPADQDEIAAWFDRWPDANVGIVTGTVSGLVVLDVDAGHGGDDTLARWEREHGPLMPTIEAVSGGGGRHLYFAAPSPCPRNRVGIGPGIDLRGEGGMIVAPPSIHPSGRRYAWRDGHGPDDRSLGPMPGWLVHLIVGEARSGHGLAHWRSIVREGVPEGERNSTIASLTGHLLWHGVDPDVALELMLAWNRMRCQPPLPDDEVARVVASITRLQDRERQAEQP
ncbi:MAG: bifunctional DNA primase/polymerase [Alphaproteobacteria bacterium]